MHRAAAFGILLATSVEPRARADAPLPNPGSPTVPLPLPPSSAPTDETVRASDETVRLPDVDGLGVMSIRRDSIAVIDGAVAHELTGDALGLVIGARVALGDELFVDGALPIAYARDAGTVALGNALAGIGWLPTGDRLVGLELRVAAGTAPDTGAGAAAVTAVAAPRVADPELYLARTTSAELVADWRWSAAAWWLQAEAGAAGWWQPTGYTTVLRATVAGGVRATPWLDVAASFATRSFVLARDSPDNFVHALLLGAIVHRQRRELALRVEWPVDADARAAHRLLVGIELRGR